MIYIYIYIFFFFVFSVINALGPGHSDRTAERSLGAAIAYSRRSTLYTNTGQQCALEGIAFEPVVFEAQGGMEPRAAAILHKVAEAVATIEGADPAKIKAQMLQRLAVIIATQNASAILRRSGPKRSMIPRAAQHALEEARSLEEA